MFYIVKPNTSIDFVGKRKIWLGLSLVAILGTLVLFFTKGLNFGIDFTGGAEIQVKIPAKWGITELRSELSRGGIENPRVQQLGEPGLNEYLIRVSASEEKLKQVSGQVQSVLSSNFEEGSYRILRADVVGPAAGSLLRQQGFLAMLYALLVILVYVAIRFDSRYAPGAVIALFHDSLIILGIFMLTGRTFDLSILAAILALIGYSNNDTIIVFDRVRETLQLHPEYSVEKAVNRAINETLGRTLVTSITTFIVVSALFFLGGETLKDFAFTLMCGVLIGTYSSVFIASSAIITLTHMRDRSQKKQAQQKSKSKKKKRYEVRPDPARGV